MKFMILDWSYTLSVFHMESTPTTLWLQEKNLSCLEVLEVKQTEGMRMNTWAEMKGSEICWIQSLLCLKATTAIHLVTMFNILNMPCWDNGMSAGQKSFQNFNFLQCRGQNMTCHWCEFNWSTRMLQSRIYDWSSWAGLFSIWIHAYIGKFSWGRTQQHKWRCRLSLQTHSSWHIWICPWWVVVPS